MARITACEVFLRFSDSYVAFYLLYYFIFTQDYRLLLDISVTYKDSWTSVNVHLLLSDIVAMIKPAMLAKHLQFRLLCRSRTLNGDIDDMSVWPIWVMVNKPAIKCTQGKGK